MNNPYTAVMKKTVIGGLDGLRKYPGAYSQERTFE